MIRFGAALAVVLGVLACVAGCRYSSNPGVPTHIKTVSVDVFGNRTFYKGLESKLTKAIIEQVNLVPGVRVVNENADATISGTVTIVTNNVTRSDADGRPASVQVSITAEFTYRDNIEQRNLIDRDAVDNSQSSGHAGSFDLDRGEARASAENAAIEELAKNIVRRSLSMW